MARVWNVAVAGAFLAMVMQEQWVLQPCSTSRFAAKI